MAKKVRAIVKLQIVGGKANPAPPVGPALGQHGVNIMEFCKAYNAATQDKIDSSRPGRDSPSSRTVPSRSSSRPPRRRSSSVTRPASAKGAANPRKDKVGKITKDQLRQIAETKMPDLNALDIEAAMKHPGRHRAEHGCHDSRLPATAGRKSARPRCTGIARAGPEGGRAGQPV